MGARFQNMESTRSEICLLEESVVTLTRFADVERGFNFVQPRDVFSALINVIPWCLCLDSCNFLRQIMEEVSRPLLRFGVTPTSIL